MPATTTYSVDVKASPRSNRSGASVSRSSAKRGRLQERSRCSRDLANWLEANIPEALAVFALPAAYRRRLEWVAKVCENLPDRPRLRDEGNEPDVTPARWTRNRKLLPHPGHQFRPGNP